MAPYGSTSVRQAPGRLLGLAALALTVSIALILAVPGSARADDCSGSTDLLSDSEVFVSIKCTFASPFFDIHATKTIDYVSGFNGLQCTHLAKDENGGENAPPGTSKEPTNWLRCDLPQAPPKPRPQTASTDGTTGKIRTVDGPACDASPLSLSVGALNPPPGTDPSDLLDGGYDTSWLRGPFPLSEVCGESNASAWAYAAPSQKASKSGKVKATVRCTEDCTLTVRGTIRVPNNGGRTIKLKELTESLSANRKKVFGWKLTRSQRRLLAGKRSKAKIAATIVSTSGIRSTLRQTVTLR